MLCLRRLGPPAAGNESIVHPQVEPCNAAALERVPGTANVISLATRFKLDPSLSRSQILHPRTNDLKLCFGTGSPHYLLQQSLVHLAIYSSSLGRPILESM